MMCPKYNNGDSKVIDSRPLSTAGNPRIRRRRECLRKRCKHRWTTYEIAGDVLDAFERFGEAIVDIRWASTQLRQVSDILAKGGYV